MLRSKAVVAFLLLAGFIVVISNVSVNTNHNVKGTTQWADGSPMPVPQPNPPGALVADGSPMPVPQPNPPGMLVADGSPMPVPQPNPPGMMAAA